MKTARVLVWTAAFLAGGFALAGSVTLEDCVAAALANHPSLRAADERIRAAAAALDATEAGYYPTVGASGSYTRTDNPPQAFFMNLNQRVASLEEDFNQPGDTANFRGSLSARMVLLDAGQRALSGAAAEAGRSAARYGRDATADAIRFDVVRSYYTVWQARAALDAMQAHAQRLEKSLAVAEAREQAGQSLPTDTMNIRVQHSAAREQIASAENNLALSIAALNNAVGVPLVERIEELAAPDPEDLPSPEPAPSAAVDERPDLKAKQSEAEAAEREAQRTGRERWPVVHAFGSWDADRGESGDFEDSYFAGAAVELDLFTGGRRKAERAMAAAKAASVRAEKEALRNAVELDMTRSRLAVETGWQRFLVSREALEQAHASQRITLVRFEEGAADVTELLMAERAVLDTMLRVDTARYDYLIARADVDRALGRAADEPMTKEPQ